jgi:hypothetical protein
MAVYRAQVAFQFDSALPRDVICVTPHYNSTDPQGLANVLKDNLIANTHVGATTVFSIKIYDALGTPPQFPLATASNGTGFTASAAPREIALCFSYYATRNAPRYRGRLYLPMAIFGGTLQLRPTTTQQQAAADLGKAFGSALPGGTQMVVYSRREKVARPVTNYWVDDEWDTVRSRGLRSSTRVTGTLP